MRRARGCRPCACWRPTLSETTPADRSLDGYAGDPLRDLIEQAHRLNELTQHPGWHVLATLAERDIAAWQARMNGGHLTDIGDYKNCAGWLEGARGVLAIPATVQGRLERAQADALETADAGAYAPGDTD